MVTFGFFNSLDHDRVYNAEQVSAIFDGIITDGVFDNYGDIFAVTPDGSSLRVIVGTGRAWFDHTWTVSDAPLSLPVEPADVSLTRIDTVVLEVNHTLPVRANAIKVVKGTPSSNPTKPVLTNTEDVHQHALAHLTVNPGVTKLTASNIEITVGRGDCPFVTSVLESVSIDALFAKWEHDFTTWFDDLQSQLSGNVASNLQNQINEVRREVETSKTEVIHEIEPIGTVKHTVRNDLSDKWLYCNGETLDMLRYPELASLLADFISVSDPLIETTQSTNIDPYSNAYRWKMISYKGFLVMTKTIRPDNTDCAIYYKKNISDTWTKHAFKTSTSEVSWVSEIQVIGDYLIAIIATMQYGTTSAQLSLYWTKSPVDQNDWHAQTLPIKGGRDYYAKITKTPSNYIIIFGSNFCYAPTVETNSWIKDSFRLNAEEGLLANNILWDPTHSLLFVFGNRSASSNTYPHIFSGPDNPSTYKQLPNHWTNSNSTQAIGVGSVFVSGDNVYFTIGTWVSYAMCTSLTTQGGVGEVVTPSKNGGYVQQYNDKYWVSIFATSNFASKLKFFTLDGKEIVENTTANAPMMFGIADNGTIQTVSAKGKQYYGFAPKLPESDTSKKYFTYIKAKE